LLREPLLHFFVAGVALFAVWEGRSSAGAARADRIVVSAATVETLAGNWARIRQRPPTPTELEGLIDDHIREEVLYREALALGLDKDDTIIRRRLRQKLEFVSEDVAAQVEPTEAQLEAYLSQNPDAFRVDPRHAFRHVYLSPGRRGAALGRDAERLLAALNRPRRRSNSCSATSSPQRWRPSTRGAGRVPSGRVMACTSCWWSGGCRGGCRPSARCATRCAENGW
jgi:hypothetical protein